MDAEDQAVFFSPRGAARCSRARHPWWSWGRSAAVIDGNRERGAAPDRRSGMPDYKQDGDIPWEVVAAVREALGREARTADAVPSGAAWEPFDAHSVLSASVGSIASARRVGTMQANIVTPVIESAYAVTNTICDP